MQLCAVPMCPSHFSAWPHSLLATAQHRTAHCHGSRRQQRKRHTRSWSEIVTRCGAAGSPASASCTRPPCLRRALQQRNLPSPGCANCATVHNQSNRDVRRVTGRCSAQGERPAPVRTACLHREGRRGKRNAAEKDSLPHPGGLDCVLEVQGGRDAHGLLEAAVLGHLRARPAPRGRGRCAWQRVAADMHGGVPAA